MLGNSPGGGPRGGCKDSPHEDPAMPEARSNCFTGLEARQKSEIVKAQMTDEDGQTELHAAVCEGHLEKVKIVVEGGANVNKPDAGGWTPKGLAQQREKKSIHDLLLSYEHRKEMDEHRIEFIEPETSGSTSNCEGNGKRHEDHQYFPSHLRKVPVKSYPCPSNPASDREEGMRSISKRVTIHMHFQNESVPERQLAKLIILPDSIDELLRVASKLSFALPQNHHFQINLIIAIMYYKFMTN